MFDRRSILKAAWTIARRRMAMFRETLRKAIRAGLMLAWEDAKEAAKVKRTRAATMAAKAIALASLTRADLEALALRLEAQDHMTFADRADLSDLRRALAG